MRRYLRVLIIEVLLFLVVVSGSYAARSLDSQQNQTESHAAPSTTVSVDELVRYPERYKGTIGVFGKIIKIDKAKSFFVLGCEDECIMLPVEYEGRLPGVDTKLTVYGEIKKTEAGKYFF